MAAEHKAGTNTVTAILLGSILAWGILTLWVPARWARSIFEIALFALAAVTIIRRAWRGRGIGVHPIGVLLAVVTTWGVLQVAAGQTVYAWATWQAVLQWLASLVAFCLALEATRDARVRLWFLTAAVVFGCLLAVAATLGLITSPGRVFWLFPTGLDTAAVGPFLYKNQYAAFIEVVLPIALAQAIWDRRRSIGYVLVAAALFASVVAAGSRAGAILCLLEILLLPLIAWRRHRISGASLAKVAVLSLAAAVLLTAVVGWSMIWRRFEEPNPYSLRAELVQSSVEMTRDRPWFGFGLGTWSTVYPGYAHFDDGLFVNQAHNDWIQWAAEGGIPFALLLAVVAAASLPPAVRFLWGIGVPVVFLHGLVDYPMQQRPALAAFFFAMLGVLMAEAADRRCRPAP